MVVATIASELGRTAAVFHTATIEALHLYFRPVVLLRPRPNGPSESRKHELAREEPQSDTQDNTSGLYVGPVVFLMTVLAVGLVASYLSEIGLAMVFAALALIGLVIKTVIKALSYRGYWQGAEWVGSKGPRESGRVKWFNEAKEMGFIKRASSTSKDYLCSQCHDRVTKKLLLDLPEEQWYLYVCLGCGRCWSDQWVQSLNYNNDPPPVLSLEPWGGECTQGDDVDVTEPATTQAS